jgi:hypothetical protein
LLLFASSVGFGQAAQVNTESFPLVESASVTRAVSANEGDRIVGNFTVSNVPSWTDSSTKNTETVQYAFKISKIEGLEKCPTDIVLYEVYQRSNATFDVYCEYTGDYRFRFNVGSGAPDLGIGNMKATLNYAIVENSSIQNPTETPTLSESQSDMDTFHPENEFISPLLVGVSALIVIFVVGIVFGVKRLKSFSHRSKTVPLLCFCNRKPTSHHG